MFFNKRSFSKKTAAFLAATLLSLALVVPANAATYTVVSNDSLYSISQTFNTSVSNIMQTNNLSNTVIYPGQAISVPAQEYTVKSGDTLYFISRKTGVSLWSLRKANNKWDDMLYIGQHLILPGVSGSTAGTAITSTSSSSGTSVKSVIPYTSAELDLLARLIYSEAGNQSYQAMVAVGAVVVNRVQDSRFPNTITDVINERNAYYYQFTPVQNGSINRPASAAARAAALEALQGKDPTNGAVSGGDIFRYEMRN
jgi:spore germination cell wall hydrolase CwlJ-like protein